MVDVTSIPELPECMARMMALQMACEFADDHHTAMAIADAFLEYIDGDTSGITAMVEF